MDSNNVAETDHTAPYEHQRQEVVNALSVILEAEVPEMCDSVLTTHDTQGWRLVAGWVARDAVRVGGLPLRTVLCTAAGVSLQLTADFARREPDPQERRKLDRERLNDMARMCCDGIADGVSVAPDTVEVAARHCGRLVANANAGRTLDRHGSTEEIVADSLLGARTYAQRLAEVLRGPREVIDGYEAEFGPLLIDNPPEEPEPEPPKQPSTQAIRARLESRLNELAPMTLEEFLQSVWGQDPHKAPVDPDAEYKALAAFDWLGGAPSQYAWHGVRMWLRTAVNNAQMRPRMLERLRELEAEAHS